MNEKKLLERINIDPEIMAGKAIIKGTRITVEYILNIMSHGDSIDDILKDHTGLEKEDILACILYAEQMLEKSNIYPIKVKVL